MSYMDRVLLGCRASTGREYEPTDVKFGLEDVLGDTKTGVGMLGTLFRASVYGGLRFNEALRFNEDVLYMFGCAALGGECAQRYARLIIYDPVRAVLGQVLQFRLYPRANPFHGKGAGAVYRCGQGR